MTDDISGGIAEFIKEIANIGNAMEEMKDFRKDPNRFIENLTENVLLMIRLSNPDDEEIIVTMFIQRLLIELKEMKK